MANKYIALVDTVLSAYTDEHIEKYTQAVAENGLSEHGFPRLTANLGVLIAHGKRKQYKDLFVKMMDLCCDQIPVALEQTRAIKNTLSHHMQLGNDFSVKEIVYCLLELEKANVFDKGITNKWRSALSKISPCRTYNAIASVPPTRIHNWAAFSAASEQLRKYAGLGDESDFIDNQIASQLLSFDENGMYRDPGEPMVYDSIPRLQLAIALHFGYNGKYRTALEELLLKSADITLMMQSVTGEIPYGGRSSQFLYNETYYAALCEFYASFFYKRKNWQKAGEFKNAARIAIDNTIMWLNRKPIHHIKNYYPQASGFGCEEYAYFDKYMISTASWLYFAHAMCNDEITEIECPAVSKNYICETSHYFHKVFCKFNDYFLEFDTNADPDYDASGLGRIHKKGAPSIISLSVPFSQKPNYNIDINNPSPLSVCAGIKAAGEYVYTYTPETIYTLTDKSLTPKELRIQFVCKMNQAMLSESVTITDDGVEITADGDGELEILFPVLKHDGLNTTEILETNGEISVIYQKYQCTYSTNGIIVDKNALYANRNGHYSAYAARALNRISLKIAIKKAHSTEDGSGSVC